MSNPLWFDRWEWRDWKGDALVRRLSKDARLFWFECLGDMHLENSFEVSGTFDELSRAIGCLTSNEVAAAVSEIARLAVADVTEHNGVVTLRSRRRWRAHNTRQANALRQKRHRESRQSNAASQGEVRNQKPELGGKPPNNPPRARRSRKEFADPQTASIPPDLAAFEAEIREFAHWRRDSLRKPILAGSWDRFMAECRKLGHGLKESIQQSIANGWQGLFEPRGTHGTGGTSQIGGGKASKAADRGYRAAQETAGKYSGVESQDRVG
jgi:hypothetical protein